MVEIHEDLLKVAIRVVPHGSETAVVCRGVVLIAEWVLGRRVIRIGEVGRLGGEFERQRSSGYVGIYVTEDRRRLRSSYPVSSGCGSEGCLRGEVVECPTNLQSAWINQNGIIVVTHHRQPISVVTNS